MNGIHDKSKVSSGGNVSGGGGMQEVKPQQPSFMNNFAADGKKKVSKSGSGDGIDEEIGDSNYDDDEFDMGSGLAQSEGVDKRSDEKDFFNQNKNFTGHLGGFADKDSNKKPSEKPSGDDSSIGFKDNYDEDFF